MEFPGIGQLAAGKALHQLRIMRSEGLLRFEQEHRALTHRQIDQAVLQHRCQLTTAKLQRGGLAVEGADQFVVICQGKTVMQCEQAVGLND